MSECKIWQCTGEVRLLERTSESIRKDVESGQHNASGVLEGFLTIQQRWLCRTTGEVQWRDVPVVSESESRS